jgi:hypothetical protein
LVLLSAVVLALAGALEDKAHLAVLHLHNNGIGVEGRLGEKAVGWNRRW